MKEYWDSLTIGKKVKFIIVSILGLLVIIFSFQNWGAGELHLFSFKASVPITLLIFISMIIGYTISSLYNHKQKALKDKEIRDLKSRLKDCMTDQKDSL